MNYNEIRHAAAEECQQDWDKLEYRDIYYEAFIAGGTFVFNDLQRKCDELTAELEDLRNGIPKLKADAIREAASELVRGVKNYDGSDVDIVNIDELIDYAAWLEESAK